MTHGVKTINVPVRDLAAAKALYRTVPGVEPYACEPCYVGFRVGDQEIGLDPNGRNHGLTGPVGYHYAGDVAESLRQAAGAGWRTRQDVKDVGGGARAAIVEDTDGNVLGSSRPAETSGTPTRTPVPGRHRAGREHDDNPPHGKDLP